eukprot:g6265.t1
MGRPSVLPLVAVILFTLAAILVPGADGASCSELNTCDACRNTTLCHWCPDQQCHAVGSPHGCIYGTYCYDNNQCQRELPEFRGYAAPSIGVILGVFLVGSTALFCGIAGISIAREYSKESAAARRRDALREAAMGGGLRAAEPSGGGNNDGYLTLAGDTDDEEDAGLIGGSINTSTEEEGWAGSKGKRDYGRGGPRRIGRASGSSARRRRRRRAAAEAAAARLGPSPLARKVSFYTRLVCGTGLAATLIICGVVVAFAPHAPGVNVCNTEFDWGSIVHSIAKVAVEADFQILVSIYNPNMLDAKIESGTAILSHKHTPVGTMAFHPAVLTGGYVTDILLTITFNGEVWEEAHLGLEYETGQLAFLMDATVSASVMWHGHKTYPFTFSIHDYYIKVSDTTDYDRSLCNCTQMMQGARQPRQVLEQEREREREQGRRRRRSEGSQRLQAQVQGGADLALAADEVLLPPTMGENVKVQ